jgi:hypothetical protein
MVFYSGFAGKEKYFNSVISASSVREKINPVNLEPFNLDSDMPCRFE